MKDDTGRLFHRDEYGWHSARELARRTDPGTSKAAAEQIVEHLPALHQWCISCVVKTPGKTQRELGTLHCPDDPRRIGRRLNELVSSGHLRLGDDRRCTVSGKSAHTYWPTKLGQEVAAWRA